MTFMASVFYRRDIHIDETVLIGHFLSRDYSLVIIEFARGGEAFSKYRHM